MTALLIISSFVTFATPSSPTVLPGGLALHCELCSERALAHHLATTHDEDRARSLEQRLKRIDREIARTSRSWPTCAVGLAIGSGVLTLVSPLLFGVGMMFALEHDSPVFFTLGLGSMIVGPVMLVAAVTWGALSANRANRRIQELQRERGQVNRELHELRRRQDDVPSAPMVPLAGLRFSWG